MQGSPFDTQHLCQIAPHLKKKPTRVKRVVKLPPKREENIVSTRTVIELNHDFLHDLRENPHYLDRLLRMAATDELIENTGRKGGVGLPGIRILGQRHHTETLELVVK